MLNIYRASAGSGKTYQLTQDYIQLLFQADKLNAHRRILAVTFTNKATDEMKTRILKELHTLSQAEKSDYRAALMTRFRMDEEAVNLEAKSILTQILHDYSSFSISTIDRFFQQVIRAFARDIGVHGGYNLELDMDSMREQSVDNLFMDLGKEEHKQLLQWLSTYAEERIENSENWNIRNDINALGSEIFKENYQHKAEETNVKLHDREFLVAYKKKLNSLKLDFAEKVKKESNAALAIIEKNGLRTEDFKGGSRSAMKKLESFIQGNFATTASFFSLAEDVDNAYAKATDKAVVANIKEAYFDGLQAHLQKLCEFLQVDIIIYNTASMVLKHITTLGIMSDLAVQIKKLTEEQNVMLISDTNLWLNKIIDNSDAPFVYEKAGIHIDHFMIDEFQDTSVLQWKNFKPLLANSLSAGKFNLVVGDVKQSIYRWRNSDWKLLGEKILTEFRSDEIKEVPLATNWRSDANIINFNNSFFGRASQLLQDKLTDSLQAVIPIYPELQDYENKIKNAYADVHQKISPKAGSGRVEFQFIADEGTAKDLEVECLNRLPGIVERLQAQGYRPNDICILVRTKKEQELVFQKLLNFKTTAEAKPECCYDVLGNEGLLVSAASSIRFLMGILKLFLNPENGIQFTIVNYEYAKACLKKEDSDALNACFGFSSVGFEGVSPLFTEEENAALLKLKHGALYDMVEQIIALFGIGSWQGEAVFVQAFQDVLFRYTSTKTADLNSFVKWWDVTGVKQYISTPDNQNAIRIMTVHKSKGLDFKAVIMPFCDWELDKRGGNTVDILWCQPTLPPFSELPLLPIEYNSTLKETIFASYYHTEQMHRYIDNLNIAYVAFTRAKNELICLAPAPKKEIKGYEEISKLSHLLMACMNKVSAVEDASNVSFSKAYNVETKVFCMGESSMPVYSEMQREEENELIQNYPSVSSSQRLHLHHQSQDYWLENQQLQDSKLNYGLIMHDVLRNISKKSDQSTAIASMVLEGRISSGEAQIVEDELELFWQMPETKLWFSDEARVLNETSILVPTGEQYRPDRVVIKGNEAIVVDYKFGDQESKKHIHQVQNYMRLISLMGYQVKGYVCYVSLRKVERVG